MENLTQRRKTSFTILVLLFFISSILQVSEADTAPSISVFQLNAYSHSSVVLAEGAVLVSVPLVSGNPEPSITFYKDGEIIPGSGPKALRKVLTLSDEGVYWIVVNNTAGAAISRKIKLSIYYLNPWSDSDTVESKAVNEGHAVVLDVPPIDANPPPDETSLDWFTNTTSVNPPIKEPVTRNINFHISRSMQLIVLSTPFWFDGKLFQAEYSNYYAAAALGITRSRKFLLDVTDSDGDVNPEFVIRLPAVTYAPEASDCTLECVVNARPIDNAQISWYRRPAGTSLKIPITTSLTYSRRHCTVKFNDSDIIFCEAGSGATLISSNTTLSAVAAPDFTVRMSLVHQVDAGSSLDLNCAVNGKPLPTITWYKNAVPLTSSSRVVIQASGTLTISNIEFLDTGVYQCVATNSEGFVTDQTHVTLNSAPATISRAPQNQTLTEGAEATIECIVAGKPQPDVHWSFTRRFGGGTIPLHTEGRRTVTNSTVHWTSTVYSDSGVYHCKANNSLATVTASGTLTVYNETRIQRGTYSTEERNSASANRTCNLNKDSRVAAQVLWYQDGRPVVNNSYRKLIDNNQTLQFSPIRSPTDEGQFTCKVYSVAGNATISYDITIIEPPLRVEPTAELASEPRAVLIRWTKPNDGNKPILKYTIRYRENSTSTNYQLQVDDLSPSDTQYIARGLKPARTYEFVVTATNVLGSSPLSDPTTPVKIAAEAPSAPPTINSLTATSARSILVRYSPPPRQSWNSETLHGYKVQYGYAVLPIDTIDVNVNVLSKEIENLLPYKEYWVKVAAYNEVPVDPPLYSTVWTVTTNEEVPEEPPVIRNSTAVSSTQCFFQWERPDSRSIKGRTLGYHVNAYKNGSSTPSATKDVPPVKQLLQETVLEALEKFTYYRVTISVYNSVGDGPVDETRCTTLEDFPEAVENLEVSVFTHDSITVTWAPPAVANGILKNYSVSVSQPGIAGSEVVRQTGETNYTVDSLEPSTAYRLEVKAATSIGLGPGRVVSRTTRPPPVRPSKATINNVTQVRSRSAKIAFSPGFNGQAPVTLWIVEARNPDQSSSEWQEIDTVTDPGSTRQDLTVEELRPHTTYIFRIIAKNIKGLSDPSEPSARITTLMAAPDAPPANVSVRVQNSSTLIINWEPLDVLSFNGDGAQYGIQYRSEHDPADKPWSTASESNPRSRFYILSGLRAYTHYTVRVVSTNSLDSSEPSNNATARTIEDVPSEGPVINRLQPSGRNLEIIWNTLSPEAANGLVLGYKIIYSPVNGEALEPVITGERGHRLTGLTGYTEYNIQVLAFTRVGDGVPSAVRRARTNQRAPSKPTSVSLQSVNMNSLVLTWKPPKYPNSPLSAISYTVRYGRTDGVDSPTVVADLGVLNYGTPALAIGREYQFNVTAVNSEGSGPTVSLLYTFTSPSSHDVPAPPQNLRIVETTARSVKLTWTKGAENGLPITNYTLWQRNESGFYTIADVDIGGRLESYTVVGLTPATKYYFKLAAVNDKGRSAESVEKSNTTEAEPPSLPPVDIQIVPKTATSLNISWTFPDRKGWNGALTATRIWYTIYDSLGNRDVNADFDHIDVTFPSSDAMLENLSPRNLYEIRLGSVNRKGPGKPSLANIIYVGVAVPVGAPTSLSPGGADDTQITISWTPILESEINGQLLGYKVYYKMMGDPSSRRKRALPADNRQYELAGPEATSHTLTNLQTYKQYEVIVTAYNIAGEGPSSPPIMASTDQGKPGPPANLTIYEVTLELVNVTWDAPAVPNGIITEYDISYSPADVKRDSFDSKSLRKKSVAHPTTSIQVNIERNTSFNFTVSAKTVKGEGNPISATYTSGPRPGSPQAPEDAEYFEEEDGVRIKWSLSSSAGGVQGYVIEGLNNDWVFVVRTVKENAKEAKLPKDLLPTDVTYSRYRVSLFNGHGLGDAAEAKEVEPFYRTWWFLVIIALAALVIIIIITAVLCCYCYRMKAKMAEEAYEQDVIGGDTYNTYEMRQSMKRDNRSGSKYRAEPPRPSPGAVLYTDEGPPRYDDSSVTEKGDLSSDDEDVKGNASATDSSDDDIDKGGASSAAPSYNNYQYGGYNPYVQSGAVQQSWQNSFGRGRHQANMYAYTDSEAESSAAPSTSHYRSTNGLINQPNGRNSSRKITINPSPDLPGSRAPLPGFSSFV